ncbi:hypothetical protein DFH28DRAFT_230538 [Melampsora americana]|nr:hypothetical protein DFH28DRAFT_230538 [Melampsora americana]
MAIKLFSFVFVAMSLLASTVDQRVAAFPWEHVNTPRSFAGDVGLDLTSSSILPRAASEKLAPMVEKPKPIPAKNPTDPIHHRRAEPPKNPAHVVEKPEPIPAKSPTDPIHHRRAEPPKTPAPVVEKPKPIPAQNPTDPIHHRRTEPPQTPAPVVEKPKPLSEVPIPPPHVFA